MKLYDYFRSSASYRVRIALNIKGIDYEKESIHLINNGGEQHDKAYINLNPQQLVPTLDDNGDILTQSLAIIEYLEETNFYPSLMPQGALARANVRSIAQIISCDIHPLNNLRVLRYLQNTFDISKKQKLDWYTHWIKRGFDSIESRITSFPRSKPVCYGSEITIADICLIPQVYNAKRFDCPLDDYPLIQEINAYCLSLEPFAKAAPEE
jgi:maleylacetoacetate isomerase